MIRLVLTSDTHHKHWDVKVPDGDILVYAGDMSRCGTLDDIDNFNYWLSTLPHAEKIVICGNHDWLFQKQPSLAEKVMTNCTYLQDEGVEYRGIRFWGSPWQPEFCNWAFNLHRNTGALARYWSFIPEDTNVLITHGPPFMHLDKVLRVHPGQTGNHQGCEELVDRLKIVKPDIHVFGHLHESYGWHFGTGDDFTLYANVSACDINYQPNNPPVVVDMEQQYKKWIVTSVSN